MLLIIKIKRFLHNQKLKITGTQIDKLRRGGVQIGSNVHIFNTYIDPLFPFLISIGDNVTLTDVKILAHDASTNKELGYTKFGKVKIGSNVFVGARTVILPNVEIGDKCIIGSGSVVTHSIPTNSVAVGNPCRVIKTYEEYITECKNAMEHTVVIDKTPVKLTLNEKKLMEELNSIGFIR